MIIIGMGGCGLMRGKCCLICRKGRGKVLKLAGTGVNNVGENGGVIGNGGGISG